MAQAAKPSAREFTVEIDGHKAFEFNVKQVDFGKFVKESQRDVNMAATNFVLNTCTDEERLREVVTEDWSLPMQIAAELQEQLIEQRNIIVKKRKPSPQT